MAIGSPASATLADKFVSRRRVVLSGVLIAGTVLVGLAFGLGDIRTSSQPAVPHVPPTSQTGTPTRARCLPPTIDKTFFGLSAITDPSLSVELAVAFALQPSLCRLGLLAQPDPSIVVDVGVNDGRDVPAWLRLFRAGGRRCNTSRVRRFLLVEPQRARYGAAIDRIASRARNRPRNGGSDANLDIAVSFDAVGESVPSGVSNAEVRVIGEGEIAMAAIEPNSRKLQHMLAMQRAHHRHASRRRGPSSEADQEKQKPWALQGDPGRTARLTTVPVLLRERFGVEEGALPTLPFVKIDTEGADAAIIASLSSYLERQRVASIVFELHRHGFMFAQTPTHALLLLLNSGYEVFLVGRDRPRAIDASASSTLHLLALPRHASDVRWTEVTELWHMSTEPHVALAVTPAVAADLRARGANVPSRLLGLSHAGCFDFARSVTTDVLAAVSAPNIARPTDTDSILPP